MKGYKSFSVTVRGGDYIKSDLDCQNASDHDNDDDANVYIAVVADGHGDSSCFRSNKGAEFAVECAKEGIKLFVKDSSKLFESTDLNNDSTPEAPSEDEFLKRIREKLIKQMVLSWNIKVEEHHAKNPFLDKELENIKEKYRIRFKEKEGINKAYGTTLIATAITPRYWFAFHIGDGRFSVLYPKGTGDQPVFWDERCFLNIVTSICDDDVLEREQINPKTGKMEPVGVRCYLSFINKDNPPPIAFFLCTDGIDDNYPVGNNETHLYRLYRTIAVGFAEKGYESNCGEDGKSGSLKRLAERFATEGKGDDTSIAGIVNIEELRKVKSAWKIKMEEAEAERAESKRKAEEEAAKKTKEEEARVAKKAANEEATTAMKAAERAAAKAEKAAAKAEEVAQSLAKVKTDIEAEQSKLRESVNAVNERKKTTAEKTTDQIAKTTADEKGKADAKAKAEEIINDMKSDSRTRRTSVNKHTANKNTIEETANEETPIVNTAETETETEKPDTPIDSAPPDQNSGKQK